LVIKIGTCGWSRLYQALPPSEREGRPEIGAYSEHYPAVEVNSSFYRFHRLGTYEGWRGEARPGFDFTLKCHRSVSHEERLRPTERALEGLERMDEAGKALGSRALLIQTPGSLEAGEGTFRDADGLFSKADVGMQLAWETRGESWWEEEGAGRELARLLERHGVVHVTDPLKSSPVHLTETAYFRLHGLPGYDLKYTYRNRELLRLYGLLKECEEGVETVYAFFNNYAMYRDGASAGPPRRRGASPLPLRAQGGWLRAPGLRGLARHEKFVGGLRGMVLLGRPRREREAQGGAGRDRGGRVRGARGA